MKSYSSEQGKNSLSLYLKEIGKIPLFSREEELDYATRAAKGDEEAKKKLLKANLRFVIRVAKKYQNQGLPLEDLISEGNIGLMKAIERFDPSKGYHFISYAVWWIKQSITSAIREKSRMIRIPRHIMKKLEDIGQIRKEIERETGKESSTAQIAVKLGIPVPQLSELLSMAQGIVSLEEPVYKDSPSELSETIEDRDARLPDEEMIDRSVISMLNRALKRLSKREANILEMRFGFNGYQRNSLQQIADKYNITKERIRQIEIKAVRKLRHSRNYYFKDYLPH